MMDPACHRNLRRYWFTLSEGPGIGVTAATEAEARDFAEAARRQVYPDSTITGVIADIRMDDLDQRHVLPNIGLVVVRGVWYPNLNVR